MGNSDRQDIVDVFYRPYIQALGNLVITFANAEAALKDMVAEFLEGDELAAVELLKKTETAKSEVLRLAQLEKLSQFDLTELTEGVQAYWNDKEARNRLMHDEWYPNLASELGPLGAAMTRGITRKKQAEVIHRKPSVEEVWLLAERFKGWRSLFSHHEYIKSRLRNS